MHIRPLKNTRNLVFTYTIMFCILVLGVFALFIIQHRSFVNMADAYDQGYFWTVEMKQNLLSLISGDGYPMWSWARGTGADLKPPIDIFMIIAALFPVGYIELGYTVAIVLRLYCAGLAFIALAGEVELDNFKRLMGAICYVFSSWAINVALLQGQFIDMLILFPLLVMGVDRIYKGKSPVMFIAAVGFCMAINYYLAFMAAIAVIIYILLRYFRYAETFRVSEYVCYIGRFVLYGIVGIMTGGFFVFASIKALMGASTGSGSQAIPVFCSMDDILRYPFKLLSEGYSFGYGYIGIPILALIVLAVAIRKISLRNTQVIMTIIMFVLSLMPIASSIMNGFSYVTSRWYFTYLLFLIWTGIECLDLKELAKARNLAAMIIWWVILVVTVPGFAYLDITGNFDGRGAAVFVCGNLLAGLLLIGVFAVSGRIGISQEKEKVIVAAIVMFTLIAGWNCSIKSDTDYYCRNNQINSQLEHSVQRAGAQIDDEGFYRIDQVDGINVHQNATQPANENIWWGTNTLYSYDSKTPASLTEFNKLVGNNYGYSKRVYVQSNGNRMGLDFLYGVKYFLGNDPDNGVIDSSNYAGYGFSYYDTVDGVEVYKNKYDSGLGFCYNNYISKSEFLKLNRLEREQALLQAVVLEDEDCRREGMTGKEIGADEIETEIDRIDYNMADSDGITFTEDGFVATKENAWFRIHVSNVENSQLMLSFDNLIRCDSAGNNIGDFYVSCSASMKTAAANNHKNNQTIPGIADYDFNLGYYENYTGGIKIKLDRPGYYSYDKLYVSAMGADNYDKYASERVDSSYRVSEYDDRHLEGTVKASEDGYLFLSLPNYKNWRVYVDGEEIEKISHANIAFTAVEIEKGSHVVELKYDYSSRIIGLIISLAGILLTVAIYIIWRRRRVR